MSVPESYSYGPYHGGPDPLAPPTDLREAIEEIGSEVMAGASPSSALDELLRRGTRSMTGLDELTRQLWQRRADIQRRHRLDGTLLEARRLLDEAVAAERLAASAEDSGEARFRQARLDALPSGTAAAVSELADYEWATEEGRRAYEQIRELLGRQLLRSRFEGMAEALRSTSPQDVERLTRMLADLNALLTAHARGFDDIDRRFAEFLRRHGEYFPEDPRDIDELIDLLAARASAAQRMLNSMTPEQRQELAELSRQAFGDQRIAQQLSQLDDRLKALRPGQDWTSSGRFRGDDPLGLAEGARAMVDLSELDALAEQLSQGYPGASLEDIDVEALRRQLGPDAAVSTRRLSELERELREQGLLERAPDGALRLTPRALRRLGETALADVVRSLRTRTGRRDTASAGAAGEPTGSTRAWQFGDSEPWAVPQTVRNAVLRSAAGDGSGAVRLQVSDVEVVETEHRARAAVALCVDTSWSMVAEGRWLPMKRTALALHHLISTRFRTDALHVVTFGRHARAVRIEELVGLEGTWEQGTNAHHALLLAQRHLRRHPDATPVVLMITDGEPTAHLDADGSAEFAYPPSPRTLAATLSEVDRIARLGAAFTVFRLGDEPRLAAFVDALARRCGGRVVAPDADGLGAAVVGDYLRHRRNR